MDAKWAKKNVPFTAAVLDTLSEEDVESVSRAAIAFAEEVEGKDIRIAIAALQNVLSSIFLSRLISDGMEGLIRVAQMCATLVGECAVAVTFGMEEGREAVAFHKGLRNLVSEMGRTE